MSKILFDGRHLVHRKTFGRGVFVQKDRRLPTGPAISDAAWWAENCPSNATGYTTEADIDRMRYSGMTHAEYLSFRSADASAKYEAFLIAKGVEISQIGGVR